MLSGLDERRCESIDPDFIKPRLGSRGVPGRLPKTHDDFVAREIYGARACLRAFVSQQRGRRKTVTLAGRTIVPEAIG
jgi:hypothetical protein